MKGNFIKKSSTLMILAFTVTGCFNGAGTVLIEGQDYIDHAMAYDGKKFIYDDTKWYINELDKVPLPDPHVFVENDTYYIVGTSDRSGCQVVDCYVTRDFVNYKKYLGIFKPQSYDGWEASNPIIYAPEIYCFDGVYYMHYSAVDENGRRHNSVVQADNPLGPYKPIVNDKVDGLNNPIFDYGTSIVLDSTMFIDDTGDMYLYYSEVESGHQIISGVKLKSPYEADWSTYKKLVRAGEKSTNNRDSALYWETLRTGGNIVEAPYMIKSEGQYYLTYSANGCWNKYYNVCYAVSKDPLGNFVKPYEEGKLWSNMLMGYPGETEEDSKVIFDQWSGFASGTGHHCFFNIGDQIMIGYHAHQNRNWDNNSFTPRYFAMDALYFDDEGVPFINGPTYSLQPMPEAISGYKNIALNATVKTENVENSSGINDNHMVKYYNLESPEQEIILKGDKAIIELTFDKKYEIGGIAIYNSAYYEKVLYNIDYIDFGKGNIIKDVEFPFNYVNYRKEFVYPVSAFTYELVKEIKTNKVTLAFDVEDTANINEVVVLGK